MNISKKPITWIEINQKAFNHNIACFKKIIGPHVALAPVIKSNAYGHGLNLIAELCEKNNNMQWLCTVSLSEAIQVRKYTPSKSILVLSIIDDDLERALEHAIDLVVYDISMVIALNDVAKKYNKKAYIHIKVDTGLSRLGVLHSQILDFITQVLKLEYIIIRALFTHLAESENNKSSFSHKQISLFNDIITRLESKNIQIPLKHISCSAALTTLPTSHFTLARLGIGIYGLWPSLDNKKVVEDKYPDFSLQPVLTWKTRIIQIKEIPALSYIGYDRTYLTLKPTKIAILPVGYWDGYDRLLSNKGFVLINNSLAPIRGRIAMNMMMVDVTNIASLQTNDSVTLLGNNPLIDASNLANLCSTINYEITTKINPLLPRIVTND